MSCIAFSQPRGGTITPPEPCTGSAKNAATRSWPSACTADFSAATEARMIAAGSLPTGLR